jgi:hypothetical protein
VLSSGNSNDCVFANTFMSLEKMLHRITVTIVGITVPLWIMGYKQGVEVRRGVQAGLYFVSVKSSS